MRHTFRYMVAPPPEPGQEVALSADDSRHLARVVRRRPGDEVELTDGAGRLWPAVVLGTGPPAVVRVGEARAAPAPAPVALYLGLAEWGRIDLVVEKTAELGLREVVLLTTERTRRVPGPEAWSRRRERLARVGAAAARQSGQAWLPAVRGLVPFSEVLAEIPTGEGYLIDPRGEASLPAAGASGGAPGRMALMVGPEAGFSEREVAAARESGLAVCRLGPTVLRSETAALVAVSLALAATGRFGAAG